MDLKKVTLIGNVVSDPESRALSSSKRVVRFTLATNYAWQDAATKRKREAVDFHDCVAFGKLGDIIAKYVKKGTKVYVEGRLRKRTSTAKNGERRTHTDILVDNTIMLGHRASSARSESAPLVRENVDIVDVDEEGEGA